MQAAEFFERDAILKQAQATATVFGRQAHAAVTVLLHHIDAALRDFTTLVDFQRPRRELLRHKFTHRLAHGAQFVV